MRKEGSGKKTKEERGEECDREMVERGKIREESISKVPVHMCKESLKRFPSFNTGDVAFKILTWEKPLALVHHRCK